MNIYVTSSDPDECVRALDDGRLRQSIDDVGVMLANAAHRVYGQDKLFKEFYSNHPLNEWLRRSDKNFVWTTQYFFSLLDENEYRFKQPYRAKLVVENIFRSLRVVKRTWLSDNTTPDSFVNFAKNQNFSYENITDVFKAYALYLDTCWKLSGGTWTNRKRPNFSKH